MWRALATGFLYEDIKVKDKHAIEGLRDALRRCPVDSLNGKDIGYGRWVRRLEIPYTLTCTESPSSVQDTLAILDRCPRVEFLARPFLAVHPDIVRFDFHADMIPLHSLKRLDWWHYNTAARSGGINSLEVVLHNAPSLQYLTVGGELWLSTLSRSGMRISSLKTIRIRKLNPIFLRLICDWDLPALENIIVDMPPTHGDALSLLWESFGNQVHTVEFSRHMAFLMTEQLTLLLRDCPSLKHLNYFVYFTLPLNGPAEHESLTSIGLHSYPCAIFDDDGWKVLSPHLHFIAESSFPSLRSVTLYGDWRSVIKDERFKEFCSVLASRNCSVICHD